MIKKIPGQSFRNTCKPEISYPCSWQFNIIGESATAITRLVMENVLEKDYTLTRSNVSSGGRYISMTLELVVHSEERRYELYRLLADGPTVKVVL